jgi:DNA ligase-1
MLALIIVRPISATEAPDIMLATRYHESENVTQFWVSEKLDGVRARWDGKQLISRGGHIFMETAWFIQDLPKQPLDGELWMGRGLYEDVVSTVQKLMPHEGWKAIKFMVFDLPSHGGTFTERVAAMKALPTTLYLKVIEQFRINSNKALMSKLDTLILQGSEGLMLHRETALYHSGRSNDILKLKPFEDAEAMVIGYKPGKGKNTGLLGSIEVRASNGNTFYIGSGFTQLERKNPPPLGSVITYRYQGFTQAGLPRFAVFIRQRHE